MTEKIRIHRCVYGEIPSLTNELVYEQSISNRAFGTWIGFCGGDKVHDPHFVVIKKTQKYNLLNSKSDPFRKQDETPNTFRLFNRIQKLRCPEGKCWMKLQRKKTEKLESETADIYKCLGHGRHEGHSQHFVRINHGRLDSVIRGNYMPIIIVSFAK